MPGHTHNAKPGEPMCTAPGCSRPAGLGTSHVGSGRCRRHGGHSSAQRSHPVPAEPTPEPSPEPSHAESDPLARRLTGCRAHPDADPLGVLRAVLASVRLAGMPFEQAWVIGAEAALSYMSPREAREWWDTLTATERAWADAYARRASRLAELTG